MPSHDTNWMLHKYLFFFCCIPRVSAAPKRRERNEGTKRRQSVKLICHHLLFSSLFISFRCCIQSKFYCFVFVLVLIISRYFPFFVPHMSGENEFLLQPGRYRRLKWRNRCKCDCMQSRSFVGRLCSFCGSIWEFIFALQNESKVRK